VSGIDDIRQRLAEIDDWPDIQRLLAIAEAAQAQAVASEGNTLVVLVDALAALDQVLVA
jgi:hypothetical protein